MNKLRLADVPERKVDDVIGKLTRAGKAVTPNAVLAEIRRENKTTKKHSRSFSLVRPIQKTDKPEER
jgi:hypothetical protein